MSKIDYQALREVAEKALHGEWGHEAGAIWNTCDSGYVQHMAAVEAGDDVSDEEHMSNMRFITLATPTVVLGLLDELSEAKAAEENESSCANSVIDIAINWQMRAKDAEAKLEAAEKRIAELEAREVALPVASCIVEDGEMCIDGFGEYVGHSLPDGRHELYAAPPMPTLQAALERLRTIVADPRALPRRKEWVSGQQYSYVLLENVEAMVDEACRTAMLKGDKS
ncbi:hypothetical protein JS866_004868 [Escherichia coli]|nr:hypothetical protein [Escherichia coli]EHD1201128.1 hypothetical protein [Escherichia coli]